VTAEIDDSDDDEDNGSSLIMMMMAVNEGARERKRKLRSGDLQ